MDITQNMVISPDINGLLNPAHYSKAERINVVQRGEPQQVNENSTTTFTMQSSGNGSGYNDYRDSYIQCDIIGTNITQEVPEIWGISWRGAGDIETSVISDVRQTFSFTFGGFVIRNRNNSSGMFDTTMSFNAITTELQHFFSTFYRLTIVNVSVDQNFWDVSSVTINRWEYRYSLSGFDELDVGVPNSNNLKLEIVNLNVKRDGTLTYMAGISYRSIQGGQLSYPRLVWGSGSLINRSYLIFGGTVPPCDNSAIINNIAVYTQDGDVDNAFLRSRALTQYGLPLNRTRRIVILPDCLPMLNEMIVPSFIRDQVEVHLEFSSASHCLVRANATQTYLITNIEFNYYKLWIDPVIDRALYNKAQSGDLSIIYHGWQNIQANIPSGTSQLQTPVTYTYSAVEKVYSVQHSISSLNNLLDQFKLSRFRRNGILSYRFQTMPGTTFPRENIQILNNDIAEAQTEFLRTVGLALNQRKFEIGTRNSCRALYNYIGDIEFYSLFLDRILQESFIIGLNLNYNSPDIKSIPVICDQSAQTVGGSGSMLMIDQMNASEASIQYIFLYYCGRFMVRPDMSIEIRK